MSEDTTKFFNIHYGLTNLLFLYELTTLSNDNFKFLKFFIFFYIFLFFVNKIFYQICKNY